MAATVKQARYSNRNIPYRGNAAYDLSYVGNAAAEEWIPGRVSHPAPLVRPKEQPRTRTKSKTKLRVRTQQKVSPFAIVGFLAVAAFAVVVLLSYVRLLEVSDNVVRMKSQIEELEKKEEILTAQYESTFDLNSIEEQFISSGTMSKPRTDQVVYIDMSEPDHAQIIDEETDGDRIKSTADSIQEFFAMAVEYFK